MPNDESRVCRGTLSGFSHGRRGGACRVAPAAGSARQPVYEPASVMLEADYDLKEVKVYDSRGEEVDPRRLPGLLKGETPALASADGRPVDPLHLRLVKEGTLVFVLPHPAATPPPAAAPGEAPRAP